MRKLSKTLLSLLLIAAMLASFVVLPAAAEEPAAEQPTEAVQAAETQAADSSFMKIFHLDCGRKYFTKDWILALINEISAAGYTHLQLAIGNDGMRFLLDDMSLTVGDKTYSSEDVAAAIHAGNEKYHDFDVDELTQKEMDEIIARAQEKNIEIIPLVNTPGHMDAILAAATSLTGSDCAYSRSARTIDVTNSTAVAFTQAFVQKYVDYFASKGCKYFNIGADEYANDKYTGGSMGFGNLQLSGKYGYFIKYVNELATMVKSADMKPVAFNDGIEFYGVTSANVGSTLYKFDKDIIVSYWSAGWSGYEPQSAANLVSNGFKVINTTGDFYYVLGKGDNFDAGYSYASNWSNTRVCGTSLNAESVVGATFCVWCDYPGAETEQEIAQKIRLPLRAMAQRMKGESVVLDENKLVSGGFKADGTINTDVDVAEDAATGIKVSAPGVKTVDVTVKTDNLPEVAGAAEVLAWEVTPRDADGNAYTGKGTVTLHIPEAWIGANVYGAVVNEDGSITEGTNLTLDEKNHTITFTVPHFSTVLAVKENKSNTIDLTVGATTTRELDGNRMEGKENPLLDNDIAKVTGEYNHQKTGTTAEKLSRISAGDEFAISDGTNYLCLSGTSLSNTTKSEDATKWTWVNSSNGFLLKAVNDSTTSTKNYYLTYSRNNELSVTDNTTSRWNYTSTDGFYISVSSIFGSSNYHIAYDSGWTATWYSSDTTGHPYKLTDVYTDKTILTITGKSAGTTTLTLGNETYTINVNYKQEQVNAVVGETTTIDVSGTLDTTGLDTTIAEVTIAGNKMTVKGLKEGNTSVRVGDTVYKISVSKGNLDTAPSLKIEFWITNKRVSEGTTYSESATSKSLAAATAHDEQGVLIADQVPSSGVISGENPVVYWKTTRLASDNKQTIGSGVDKTRSGNDFTYIRYWSGNWSYSTDRENWVNFEDGDQIVAYYLQKTTVTKEVETQVVDWGYQKDQWSSLNYLDTKYVLMDYSVKYESGEESPSLFPTNDSLGFHCDVTTSKNGVYYRQIGMTRAVETDNYEVYMITLTPSSDTPTDKLASTAAKNSSYTYGGTEKIVWVDTQEDLDASELGTYTSISGTFTYSIGGEPIVPGVEIYRQQAMKVTYYLRARKTPDSLTVHYIDKKANKEFYSYNIAVEAGTVFNENIGLGNPVNGELNNGTVTNLQGKQQIVSANLSTMPAIGAQYRYSDYTCVKVVRSTATTDEPAGKEVFLYYTFNNSHIFVVDFGVPLKIKATDIGVTVPEGDSYWTEATCTGAVYGETKIATGEGLIYTATKPMLGIETLNVTLATGTGEDDKATHTIYLVPATTVYYEQNVATYSDGWSLNGTAIAADKYQETQKGRTAGCNFGYDPYYKENQLGANGSVMYTTTPGESAQLTFKGTGMELYLRTQNANNTTKPSDEAAQDVTDHSYMLVQVYAGDTTDANSLKRMSFVDVNNLFVESKNGYGYNTPCWTVDGMTYGTYTVVVRYVKGTTYGLAIDGFRVTNTLNPDNATTKDFYAAVGEANMQTAEIRNMVLAQANVNNNAIFGMSAPMYQVGVNEVLDAVFDDKDVISGAAIIASNGTVNTNVTVDKDLVNIGPKNEIYLQQGQAVVMELTGNYASVQVGMRSLTGETVKYQINSEPTKEMNSTVDMYYKVSLAEGKLVIQNVSGGILALTKLKVTSAAAASTDDPGVVPQTTPEAIRYAMALMRGIDVPQFTDVAEDAWYHDYVYDLVYCGVVNGMTATTYEPEGKLTRAQFVKLLACSLADAETLKTYEGKHPFKDSEGHWAETYIAWAKDKGIVEGVSATEFDPEAPITREQMATIFGRYALKQGIELPKSDNAAGSFPDADKISEYAREFVELMRIAGILNGYEDGTFRPQGNATRAEAAKLFSLFLSITDKLAK